jgi:hypothetical protein
MRTTLAVIVLILGLGLAVAGFFLAAPIGATVSPEVSNPRLLFAPGIFVIGVVLFFLSAIVYELVPDDK